MPRRVSQLGPESGMTIGGIKPTGHWHAHDAWRQTGSLAGTWAIEFLISAMMPQPTADNSAIRCPPRQASTIRFAGCVAVSRIRRSPNTTWRGFAYGPRLRGESSGLYCPFSWDTDRGCERRVIRRATAARPITRNESVEGSGMGSTVMYASNSASFSRRKPLLRLAKSGGGRAPSGRDSPMNSGVSFHPNVSTIGSTIPPPNARTVRSLSGQCPDWTYIVQEDCQFPRHARIARVR